MFSKDQTRALEALLAACRAYVANPSTLNDCKLSDAYALCRAVGIAFNADGSARLDSSHSSKG